MVLGFCGVVIKKDQKKDHHYPLTLFSNDLG